MCVLSKYLSMHDGEGMSTRMAKVNLVIDDDVWPRISNMLEAADKPHKDSFYPPSGQSDVLDIYNAGGTHISHYRDMQVPRQAWDCCPQCWLAAALQSL